MKQRQSIFLDMGQPRENEFNEYTIQSNISTANNLLKVQKVNSDIINNIINICDNSITLLKNTIKDNIRFNSNIEVSVFTLKYEFNDGIGELKTRKYSDDYSCEYYEKHIMFKKYTDIMSMLDEYDNVSEIIMENWKDKTYLAFNVYINKKVDKKNNIKIYSPPFNHPTIMTIGEKYWVGQPEQRRISSVREQTLTNIIKEGNLYRFVFDKIDEDDSPYSMVAKGNVGIKEDNINRIEDHIVIRKHKSSFIKAFLSYSSDILDVMGNNPDNDFKVKESIKKALDLF